MNSKSFGLALVSAMALMTFTASNAAATTTIATGGVAYLGAETIEATIASGGSWLLTDTAGFAANTCTSSTLKWGTSSPYTGTTVSGPLSTFASSNCSEGNPTVDAAGTISLEHVSGTALKGTVRWSGGKLTIPSFFGPLTCTTSNTDIGMLTGVTSSTGVLDINTVLSCTVIGSAKWSGTYVVTTPGIAVVE